MVDRLELARQFVKEQLETRDEVIASFAGGPVASGDAIEASEPDLARVAAGQGNEGPRRGGLDTWRDGLCVEAALVLKGRHDGAQKVLHNPFAATHMNEAWILYEPTSLFSRVQREVGLAFMESRWLGVRVHTQLEELRSALSGLREAVSDANALAIGAHEMWVSFWLVSVPLVREGITPSSTRALLQLESVAPALKDELCEWEGSVGLSGGDVLSLLPTVSESLALFDAMGSSEWGRLSAYFTEKAERLAKREHPQAAMHIMWFTVSGLAQVAQDCEDELISSQVTTLVQIWLRATGWDGREVLQQKVRMAEEMVAEVEQLAAQLPSDELRTSLSSEQPWSAEAEAAASPSTRPPRL